MATPPTDVLGKPFLSLVLWAVLAMYLVMDAGWLVEVVVAWWARDPLPIEYGPDHIQLRILTIDGEDVVQRTVNDIPTTFTDCHVIAETPLSIAGAEVHVVPDDFQCKASRKGRALEWARRNIPCQKEFVLFLDEDTILGDDFDGLPDGDIIQIRELPQRTGSWMSFFAEMYRMGFQIEQLAFPRFQYPHYTWGGGLAIRRSLENEITWDVDTMIEDTVFVWRAALARDVEFRVLPVKFRNQAPPSVRELIKQRRRWIAGSREGIAILPTRYVVLYRFRDLSWALSSLMPVIFVAPYAVPNVIVYQGLFKAASLALYGFVLAWCLTGIWYYGFPWPESIGLLLLSPVIVIPHAAGALYGRLSKPATFEVTRKSLPGPTSEPRPEPAAPAHPPDIGSGGRSVLLLDTPATAGWDGCLGLLAPATHDQRNVLLVSDSVEPTEWLDRLEEPIESFPNRIEIVAPIAGAPDAPSDREVGRRDPAPFDASYLVIAIDTYLRRWAAPTSICIDSLARLIDMSSVEEIIGFITVINDVIEDTDTVIHFHLDPTRISPLAVRRISWRCDVVVEGPAASQGHPDRAAHRTRDER